MAERRATQSWPTPVRVLNILGIRAAESPARAKKSAFSNDKRASNSKRVVDTWFPIFDWTLDEVWARIRKSGVEHHRAYDLGLPRLSCVFCIFAQEPVLIVAGSHNPELLDAYVAVEERIGHTFKKDLSLASVRQAIREGTAATISAADLAGCEGGPS